MSQDLISVIIPAYNCEKYVRRCLDSITSQTYSELEIIVVDDGSTDQTGMICDEFAKEDDRIMVFHQNNRGQASARNIALEKCHGNWISFIDADDYIDPNTYTKLMACLNDNDADLLFFNHMVVTPTETYKPEENQDYPIGWISKEEAMALLTTDACGNYPCNKIYKKKLWKDIRFPEGRIFEDVLVMYKIVEKAEKIYRVNDYYYYYYRGGISTVQSQTEKRYREIVVAIREQYDYFVSQHYTKAAKLAKDQLVARALAYVMKIRKNESEKYKCCERELIIDNYYPEILGIKRKIALYLFRNYRFLFDAYCDFKGKRIA